MIKRYVNKKIEEIWALGKKYELWLMLELTVIRIRCAMGMFPKYTHEKICDALGEIEFGDKQIAEIAEIEKKTKHDLNAFIEWIKARLPVDLRMYIHWKMTSYDTEEAPFSLMLLESFDLVIQQCDHLCDVLHEMVYKYRYVPMLGRTHGQEAKLQSFGLRALRWYLALDEARQQLLDSQKEIKLSKLSGAIGNYQGITPEEEDAVLRSLGLKPFVGASQIMPRILHQPLVNALLMIVGSLTQIAEDIRIAARSGLPLMQEFFDKGQMGSSAMPHKKNTITCENQIGTWRMAKGYGNMLRDCMLTWEERAIEQSCVERVAWPDLFHVVMQSFKNMASVLERLQVFPDHMMLEIDNSHGCYASEEAKELLKEFGLIDEAYKIVQLAAANVHEHGQVLSDYRKQLQASSVEGYPDIDDAVLLGKHYRSEEVDSINRVISQGDLRPAEALGHSEETVSAWNKKLKEIFADPKKLEKWNEVFTITFQLRNESFIFETHK
ncbi:MAG: lyase family protein [Patescibacteria group bacterium]|nr:lyase family protein [Patescibacteria group bacterium]